MKAMVLAAGFGTRLRPITNVTPKPLFPVMGRPVAEHLFDLLRSAGINDITMNLHHLPDKLTDHFGDGSGFDIKLNYSRENEILGTAGGIKAAQKFLDGGPFIVINSDILVDIDLQKVIHFHKEKKSCLTLVLREGDLSKPHDPVQLDAENRVIFFLKNSSKAFPELNRRFTFTGIQIMEPEIFARIPSEKFCGTTEEIFPQMVEEKMPVYAYVHDGYWNDMGKREDYLQAHKDFLNGKFQLTGKPDLKQVDGPEIQPAVYAGKDCAIAGDAKLGPYVVLGENCVIEDGVSLENVVCFQNVKIEKGSAVRNSIIGEGVTVGGQEIISDKSLA